MGAVCQIDLCGVVAVGRCGSCGNAFCPTHQARSGVQVYVDCCTTCPEQRRLAAATQQRKVAEAFDRSLTELVAVLASPRKSGPDRFRHMHYDLENRKRRSWNRKRSPMECPNGHADCQNMEPRLKTLHPWYEAPSWKLMTIQRKNYKNEYSINVHVLNDNRVLLARGNGILENAAGEVETHYSIIHKPLYAHELSDFSFGRGHVGSGDVTKAMLILAQRISEG